MSSNRPQLPAVIRPLFVSLILFPWIGAPVCAQVGGVYIDAKGMLRETKSLSADERLKLLREHAAARPGTFEAARSSELRKVSLKRLEETAARLHGDNKPLPPDIRYFAGLTRVDYVLFYPEKGDVVLAGPAEGWKQLETGEVVGGKSGRPVLHLDDLLAALRYAFAESADEFIGCSIEPTPEGAKRYVAHLRRLARVDRPQPGRFFAGLEEAMGPQEVKLYGVDRSSRFALTMLAADYRLKRIAMGHDPSPVREVVSYLDLAARRFRPGAQPQHRWWFVARYDAIQHTPDGLAWRFDGQGVQVATAPSSLASSSVSDAAPAARQFAETMTKHLPQMAQRVPVFAELQNLVSLSLVAELVAQKHFAPASDGEASHWSPGHFLDETACPIQRYPVPKHVPSISSYRLIGGRQWLIAVSGGVEINPRKLVAGEHLKTGAAPKLAVVRSRHARSGKVGGWWWD